MARTSPSPNETGIKQQTYNNLNTQVSNESYPTKRESRMQKGLLQISYSWILIFD